ncbi:MAG TPA: 23S rRNA (guanosine(2251)-2'-O)-methyltransferase RlmB [Candidatus Binatia bacterium]|jgi:23S rRNA (guanosine2251-2'-O)-methyltransferase|nr:23S rRNA (guanosine(2251)-2'-O)-methyltransferase RlmB [Candidatus Binatia bacterium]
MNGGKQFQFIFGVNPVLEKLKASPQEVLEVLMFPGRSRAALRLIEDRAKAQGLRVRYLKSQQLDRIAEGSRHQGVIAKVESYSYAFFDALLQALPPSTGHDWILCLDGLNDPRNFGALLRCAEGAGIRHVIIPKDRSVEVTPAVMKTSAGAAHYVKIYRVSNLRRAILALKEKGYWAVGLDAKARDSLYEKLYPEKLVIVLGSEGRGIRPLVLQECDFLVSIPMRGKIASLNVAAAGSIFFYELLRQKERP